MKSKKIYAVAIALLAVFVTAVFVGCTSSQTDVKAVDADDTLGNIAYSYLLALSGEEFKNRTMGDQGALDTAKYIADEMTQLGYKGVYSSDEGQGLQKFKTSFKRFDRTEMTDTPAYNVIFSKKSNLEKSKGEIILSCSYDNLYSEKAVNGETLWNADGSYESGSSVALLLTLAKALEDKSCEYDLTFAFFSGGCYGWKGARNYVDNLDRAKLDNIALVINFAMLGGGDNWYIYTGESVNTYGKYLNASAARYVSAVPKDRNIAQFTLSDDAIYDYTNIGMLSNQYFFDTKGVPTANILSLNWEINDNPFFSEMKGKDNVYHTKNDTLQNMIERKGEENIKAQFFEIISSMLTALDETNKDTFTASLGAARKELPDAAAQSGKNANLVNIIVKVILIASLIGVSFIIKTYLSKNIDKYIQAQKAKENADSDSEEKSEPFVFEENIFNGADGDEFSEQEEKRENNDDEDPFL